MDQSETHKPKIKIKIKTNHELDKGCTETHKNTEKKQTHRFVFSPNGKLDVVTVKTSLKSILQNYDHNFPTINRLVIDCHDMVTRTYQFIRLYLLHRYYQIQEQINIGIIQTPPDTLFPVLEKSRKGVKIISKEIDIDLILYFLRACGTKDARGKKVSNQKLKEELDEFYEREFKPCLNKEKYDLTNKTYLITYLAQQIQTSFNNNIKEHFLTRIRRFMNLTNPYPETEKRLFGKVKTLILLDRHDKIPSEYQEWSQMIKHQYLPREYQICYGYDVKVCPEKYIYYLLKMNDHIEQINQQIQNSQLSVEEKRLRTTKLFQPIPLRNTIIPCYITIDANVILSLFGDKGESHIKKQTKENSDYLWRKLFDTDKKVMKKKGYQFHSIQTDGIGASICFQKIGRSKFRKDKGQDTDRDVYIDDLTDEEVTHCSDRKLIGGDPGKESLVYLMDEKKKKLRYTSSQRRVESHQQRCREITLREKVKYHIQEEEGVLSRYNCKTVDYQQFKEYIKLKTLMNDKIGTFYQQELYRKMKWRVYIDRRQSEDHFLNRIESTYGKREEILICYGNWSQNRQMKHLMPTLGVGLRRIIQKRFDLLLVDEWGSSKYCNQCHHELEHHKNLYRVLVCPVCQNSGLEIKKTCFFNRDANACMNMVYLSREWLQHRNRPYPYNRITDPDLVRGKPVC